MDNEILQQMIRPATLQCGVLRAGSDYVETTHSHIDRLSSLRKPLHLENLDSAVVSWLADTDM